MLFQSNILDTFSRELIFIMDIKGNIKEISPNFDVLLGYCRECHIGKNIRSLMINTDIDFTPRESINLILKNKDEKTLFYDGWLNQFYHNGEELLILSAINITNYLSKGEKSDRNEIRNLKEQLERLSYYDSLTGLYNRNFIEYEMDKLNLLEDVPLGMIICDLDNLKVINDTFGHSEGDYLLQQAAGIIKEPLGENMTSGRIGGDEFIVLLKNVTRDKVREIYERISLGVIKHNKTAPRIAVEISIGYSYTESSLGATKELFKAADEQMYIEKKERHRRHHKEIISKVI